MQRQQVYGTSLYFPLNFAVNLKLLLKIIKVSKNDLAGFRQHTRLELQMLSVSLDSIIPASSFMKQFLSAQPKIVSKPNPKSLHPG